MSPSDPSGRLFRGNGTWGWTTEWTKAEAVHLRKRLDAMKRRTWSDAVRSELGPMPTYLTHAIARHFAKAYERQHPGRIGPPRAPRIRKQLECMTDQQRLAIYNVGRTSLGTLKAALGR